MYVVFSNPSGWPDRMKVRNRADFHKREERLRARGHQITELASFGTVDETWAFMLKAQREFKAERYGEGVVMNLDRC